MQNTLTIATINLWRFHEWEKRLPAILSLLKEINPDIILTQETQRDISIDPRNQIEILNEALKYPYSFFAQADIKTTRKGVLLPNPVDHGLAALSRFPFTAETIKLTKARDDKEQRILLTCNVTIGDHNHTITNVHFSNSDRWAEEHLKETFKILKERGIESILIGDFNIRNLSYYKDLYEPSHISSGDEFIYTSYPKDNVSYDYILLPHKYRFMKFECREEMVSDHKLLVAKVELK